MKKSTKLVLAVLSLFVCATLCFAWINEIEKLSGRYMEFSMQNGKAVIAAADLEVQLFKDSDGLDNYVDITEELEEGNNAVLTHIENFAPGARQKFRADITNTANVPVYVHMVLSGIECENVELQKNLVVGTSGFSGFVAPYLPPQLVSNSLYDGTKNGTFSLLDGAEIPPNRTISVYFYVIFSETATETLSNKNFTIGSINFLTV
ncbi:MAG: hypothetical protein IKU10_03320 [Clostridia bacterium]|nr:hypothetical protein [Clostridia bacterium]